MTENFTQNDVVQLIYGELSASKSAALQDAMIIDPDLSQDFDDFCEVYHALERMDFAPSEKTVQNILTYAKSLDLHSLPE